MCHLVVVKTVSNKSKIILFELEKLLRRYTAGVVKKKIYWSWYYDVLRIWNQPKRNELDRRCHQSLKPGEIDAAGCVTGKPM
jgi:glutamate dehydrogenase (NAD(P)+)